MADTNIALQFLVELSRVTRTIRMYSPEHPAVQKGTELAYRMLKAVLDAKERITLGRKDGQLIYQGQPVRGGSQASERFFDLLAEKGIDTVTLLRGLTSDELVEFIKVIGVKEHTASQSGAFRQMNGLPHIEVNTLTYKAVSDEQEMILDRFNWDVSFRSLLSRPPEEVNAAFSNMLNQLNGELSQLPIEEQSLALREHFQQASQQLFDRFGVGVDNVATHLQTIIMGLAPPVQDKLFGRTYAQAEEIDLGAFLQQLGPIIKAGLLVNELQAGDLSGEDWQAKLDRLLDTDADVVGLAEQIAKKLGENQQLEENQEALSRLLRLLQQQAGEEAADPPSRGRIVIADQEAHYIAQYEEVLGGSGFEVEVHDSGAAALRSIRNDPPDCLVLDIPLKEMTGLEVIATLDAERRGVPIVVCSSRDTFKDAFEVKMYPHLAYMTKPFEILEFLNAVEHFALLKRASASGPIRALSLQEEEDLDKARAVQTQLLPKEIPQLVGYELATYYRSSREVGGDYFDIFVLDEDHTGLLIADVSGKGFSGAMVMCMARTVFHSIINESLSPREILLRANSLIHRDLARGMFLSVMYMVLNNRTGRVSFSCAGHEPALIFTESFGVASFTTPSGIALGLASNEIFEKSILEEKFDLRSGDQVLLYTDGVLEAMNEKRVEFGDQRMTQLVNQNQGLTTQRLLELIVTEIKAHVDGAPQHDDITLVGLRML